MRPLVPLALAAAAFLAAGLTVAVAADDKNKKPTFEGDVKPLFSKYGCTDCHNPDKVRKSKVDLSTYQATMKGVKAGNPAQSKVVIMIENGKMPPKKASKKVESVDLNLLKAWIGAGAPEK